MRGLRPSVGRTREFYPPIPAAASFFTSSVRSDFSTAPRASLIARRTSFIAARTSLSATLTSLIAARVPLLQRVFPSCNLCTVHCSPCFLHCRTCFPYCSACSDVTRPAIKHRHPATTQQPAPEGNNAPQKPRQRPQPSLSPNFFAAHAPLHPTSPPALPLRLPVPPCKYRPRLSGTRRLNLL